MSQAALFPPSVSITSSGDDPLIDVIKSFGKHTDRFCEDLISTINEYIDDTLYDAMELREAAGELETIIKVLSSRRTGLLEKAQDIINTCQNIGHILEGNLQIVNKESQGRRSVDKDLLLQERPDVYQTLVNIEIESIKCSYTPTIAALKGLLKKQHEHFLKPGEITTTYDIEVILQEDRNVC